MVLGISFFSFGQSPEESFWKQFRNPTKETPQGETQESTFKESSYCLERPIELWLDSLAENSRKARLIHGFRILLFSGNTREEATKAKELAYKNFPNLDVYTTYSNPTFKVKLGDFYMKLDAYLVLKKLQTVFPNAVLVEEIVNLKI